MKEEKYQMTFKVAQAEVWERKQGVLSEALGIK